MRNSQRQEWIFFPEERDGNYFSLRNPLDWRLNATESIALSRHVKNDRWLDRHRFSIDPSNEDCAIESASMLVIAAFYSLINLLNR
mmetsp:Transcript_21573/g.45373  ORF Transcript_21573/g.45373 Transcript_21573/m.45373 type:complete len:86 (-) Transcript_21573:1184-1441(-)